MSTGLTHAAQLVARARKDLGMTLVEFRKVTNVSRSSIISLEDAQRVPRPETLEKLEIYLGWRRGLLTEIIESDNPEEVIDEAGLGEPFPETEISDEALLWELTHRLQSKDNLIDMLQKRLRELEAENQRLRDQ